MMISEKERIHGIGFATDISTHIYISDIEFAILGSFFPSYC
jgi:hypothetical protein